MKLISILNLGLCLVALVSVKDITRGLQATKAAVSSNDGSFQVADGSLSCGDYCGSGGMCYCSCSGAYYIGPGSTCQ